MGKLVCPRISFDYYAKSTHAIKFNLSYCQLSTNIIMVTMKYFALYFFCAISASALAEDAPSVPYYDWGACPFECCAYKEWTTSKPIVAYEKPSRSSKKRFTMPAKQAVTGITGVVITNRYGIVRILKPVKLGYTQNSEGTVLSLAPGEKIYRLHYLGEGSDIFWYKGKTYEGQFDESTEEGSAVSGSIKLETDYDATWWVQFKDSKGRVGWSEGEANFDHMDTCE